MDRRKALRGIGSSVGLMMASPALISMLQSCNTEQASWIPVNMTPEQGTAIRNIVDLIIPKTDTPSATEVNVPEFIDKYIDGCLLDDEKTLFNWKLDGMIGHLKEKYNENISDITTEQYDQFLASQLKADTDKQSELYNNLYTYTSAVQKGEIVDADLEVVSFGALQTLRDLTIFAFKNSRQIGEEVLAYDPVPGAYNGCESLEELTGGKAWSL